MNLAPERTREAFVALGLHHFEELFTVYKATPLFDQLETGHVRPEDFVSTLKKELPGDTADQQIVDAWNAMLLDFRLPALEYVQGLKAARPVFLFSNTNQIHYQYFQDAIRRETPFAHLDDLFHKAYYSHDIGFRKPDAGGYLRIIREQGLDPATTLFVDDNAQNIAGARAVGLQAHHFLSEERVETLLPSLLAGAV